jgi:hypothetical protein
MSIGARMSAQVPTSFGPSSVIAAISRSKDACNPLLDDGVKTEGASNTCSSHAVDKDTQASVDTVAAALAAPPAPHPAPIAAVSACAPLTHKGPSSSSPLVPVPYPMVSPALSDKGTAASLKAEESEHPRGLGECKAEKSNHVSSAYICQTKGCTRKASCCWGTRGEPVACSVHRQEGMNQKQAVTCQHAGCKTYPSFSGVGDVKRRFCKVHRTDDMVNVNRRSCQNAGCMRQAMWQDPENGKIRYCTEHRQEGMVCAYKSVICAYSGCVKQPCYGSPSDGRPIRCASHKEPGMKEMRSRKCAEEGCKRVPSYGFNNKRQCCRTHRAPGMTYCILTCENAACSKNPSFAFKGEKKRRFCKQHALPGMVNIYYKYCDTEGCVARYVAENPATSRKACKAHMEPDMVLKVQKVDAPAPPREAKCEWVGCTKSVSGRGCHFCSQHQQRLEEWRSDEVNEPQRDAAAIEYPIKLCTAPHCAQAASFGYMNDRVGRYCGLHQMPNMVHCNEWAGMALDTMEAQHSLGLSSFSRARPADDMMQLLPLPISDAMGPHHSHLGPVSLMDDGAASSLQLLHMGVSGVDPLHKRMKLEDVREGSESAMLDHRLHLSDDESSRGATELPLAEGECNFLTSATLMKAMDTVDGSSTTKDIPQKGNHVHLCSAPRALKHSKLPLYKSLTA